MKRFMILWALVLSSLTAMTGCAGYHRGSAVPQALRTVHVPAFTNQTQFPMVGAQTAQQFLALMIEDGTFSPTDFDHAKLRVQADIVSLTSNAVRYDRNYAIVPDEYHLRLTAKLFVYRADTGEALIDGKLISATDSMLTRGDYQTALMDVMPRLSRQLGQNLLDVLHTVR